MTGYIAQLRSEMTKINRSALMVLAGLAALVAIAIGLHAFGLSASSLSARNQQRGILADVGCNLGSAFAALLGALLITTEFRNGTIRPTLLASPRRTLVFAAKAGSALVLGALAGVIATGVGAGLAVIGFDIRGITVHLTAGNFVQLVGGAAIGGALWGIIGLAVGCFVRLQVPTIVGLFAWILFVENIVGDLPKIHRFLPGALVQSLAGQTRGGVLGSAVLAGLVLCAYAFVVAAGGFTRFRKQDVA